MTDTILPLVPGLRSLRRSLDGTNTSLPIVAMRHTLGGTVHYFEPSGKLAAAVLFPEGLVYAGISEYFNCEKDFWAAFDGQK